MMLPFSATGNLQLGNHHLHCGIQLVAGGVMATVKRWRLSSDVIHIHLPVCDAIRLTCAHAAVVFLVLYRKHLLMFVIHIRAQAHAPLR